ncbi:P-loop containing nucleoside triphosphate hydrolase protein [Kockiozyma suomiensis]|uniref:P-loop containing nucleoside triphosphate hydrolase protein n=1 Tax=Kockiozyma suomiensis TaxID=1337062 RepID=UPI0033442F4F
MSKSKNEIEEEKAERKRLRKLEKKEKKMRKAAAEDELSKSAKDSTDSTGSTDKTERKDKKDKREKKDKKEATESTSEPVGGEKKSKKDKKRDAESLDEPAFKKSKTVATPAVKNTASDSAVDSFLKESDITITDPLNENHKPVLSFSDIVLDSRVLKFLTKYPKPTPIQSAAWPALLAGRDVIGVAETGSGKTMAFAVPAVSYLLSNKIAKKASVLIISPTRELAMQIHDNLDDLGKAVGIKSVCVYGGVPKDQQRRDLKGASVVVATPGRLIDLVNDGDIDLSQITYLVLDEADRMLEKGFEEDIKRVMSATDPMKRKTVMFTATWPPSVRDLASQFLKDPVKVMIGDRESELKANSRITQTVEVMDPRDKEQRLLQVLTQFQSENSKKDRILIFALYKKEAARVEQTLQRRGYNVAAIHGDLSQIQRQNALENFKNGSCPLLLATDVAARGLDIPAVKLVINLTFPLTAEDYVHRIGRTGRAGQTGKAITFFTEHEKHLSGALINVLRSADQPVPEDLLKFGGHTKKKAHSAYGAFFKEIDPTKKAKKIVFD